MGIDPAITTTCGTKADSRNVYVISAKIAVVDHFRPSGMSTRAEYLARPHQSHRTEDQSPGRSPEGITLAGAAALCGGRDRRCAFVGRRLAWLSAARGPARGV